MFLHSGASLHGHEYSARTPAANTAPGNRRAPLLRSAFATPISRPSPAAAAAAPAAENTKPALRPARRRRLSEGAPTGSSIASEQQPPVVRFQEPEVDDLEEAGGGGGSGSGPTKRPEPMSEDEASYSASEISYLSDTAAAPRAPAAVPRRRRTPRKSTAYLFAHPAPKPRVKKQLPIHIRPRLILQLQQLSADRRPRPAIDVFPSSLIAGNVVAPRFSKRFPRLFGVKGELGLHDTILVRSEDYGAHGPDAADSSDGDDDSSGLERRELVAVLSPLRRDDRDEIILNDGSVWVATPLPTGSYDFVHVDGHGNATTARWVRRSAAKTSATTGPISPAGSELPSPGGSSILSANATPTTAAAAAAAAATEYKYTFSVINPQSRRHPIMGTLTPSTLEILDHYTTVSQSSGRYPPSKSMSRSLSSPPPPTVVSAPATPSALSDDEDGGVRLSMPRPASPPRQRTTYPIDEALKNLMAVTAIWVTLKQGWTQNPRLAAEAAAAGPGAPFSSLPAVAGSSINSRLARPSRNSPRGEGSQTPEPISDPLSSSRILGLRKGQTMPLAKAPPLRDSSPAPSLGGGGGASRPPHPPLARRATSTGAAFMQRRMQTYMSDASDSERGGGGGGGSSSRRSRGRRVLSGDFAGLRKPAATTDVLPRGSERPSSARERTASSVLPSPQPYHDNDTKTLPPPSDRARKTQSAYYYPTTQVMSLASPTAEGSDGLDLARGGGGHLTEDEYGPGAGARTPRWRRLGHWFRRLGGR